MHQWAPAIANNSTDVTHSLGFVEEIVAYLDSVVQGMRTDRTLSFTHGRRHYSAPLFRFLVVANVLTDKGDLKDVVRLCAKLALPPHLQSLSCMSYDVPLAGTLSRNTASLDLSYCGWWRKRWDAGETITCMGDVGADGASHMLHPYGRFLKETYCDNPDVPYYMMADRSPQFGRDWLLAEFVVIEGMTQLFEAVDQLVALVPEDLHRRCVSFSPATGDRADPEEWQVWEKALTFDQRKTLATASSKIQELCQRHVLKPTGIGARRASLLHKFHCILHAMFQDSGSWWRVATLAGSSGQRHVGS